MIYIHNDTKEQVDAHMVSDVMLTPLGNYALVLPTAHKIVGLYLEQTQSYTPVIGDYYIDSGEIKDSQPVIQADFDKVYTSKDPIETQDIEV